MMLGQFPAAALMFRRGDVTTGPPALVEHRSLEQIYGRIPPIIAEDPGTTRIVTLATRPGGRTWPTASTRWRTWSGRWRSTYGSDPAKTKVADLARFIDRKARVVRSATGQLVWDYGRGFCG